VSVTFALGAAPWLLAPPLALGLRDDLVPLAAVCGGAGAWLREQLLEAASPGDALVGDGGLPDRAEGRWSCVLTRR